MSKAALQASNNNVQSVVNGSQISVGSINLRFGRDICVNEGSIVFKSCGYYMIDCSVTAQPEAIGEVAVKLQHNGVDIPGATTFGYASAADQNVTMKLSAMIRVTTNNSCPCQNLPDTLSCVLVDGAGDVVGVMTDVVKL